MFEIDSQRLTLFDAGRQQKINQCIRTRIRLCAAAVTVCGEQDFIILFGSQHSGDGADGGALRDLLGGVNDQHAILMQPAEKGFGGSDAPRQRLGTARHVALLFHPFEVTVEVFRGDLAEGTIFGEELGEQTYIREEGFDRVWRTSLIRQETFPRVDGGGEQCILI